MASHKTFVLVAAGLALACPVRAQDAPRSDAGDDGRALLTGDNDVFGIAAGGGIFPTIAFVGDQTRTFPAPLNIRFGVFAWSDRTSSLPNLLDMDMSLLVGASIALVGLVAEIPPDYGIERIVYPSSLEDPARVIGYGHAIDFRAGYLVMPLGPVHLGVTMHVDLGVLNVGLRDVASGALIQGNKEAGAGYGAGGGGVLFAYEPTRSLALLVNPQFDVMLTAVSEDYFLGLGGRVDVDVVYGLFEDLLSVRVNGRGEHRWFRFSETGGGESNISHFRLVTELVFALDGIASMRDH